MPNAWQSLVELIHDFMLNLINEQIYGQERLSNTIKFYLFPFISFLCKAHFHFINLKN